MLKNIKRALTVVGTAGAAVTLAATSAFASGGVHYPTQTHQSTYKKCIDTTSGGSRYSSTYGGYVFVADSFGSAPGCEYSYVEVVYVDKSGNEQVKRASAKGSLTDGPNTHIFLYPSQYKKVLEVIGSSRDWSGNSSGGVYLYF
ncbi:hypothetical protein [Streptomyces camelliae]|uniref:Spore-associated protein A n=1 Tax=Streptomyces camelliae TaxID=3004093 RepID=A0ABY7PCE9_9ACTN|nr:hypothetical protein [Streptomyces sp. HUAS 2-6]WBO65958.1 hypothetical protein O1G22_25695 [Streptomyces sp. HUAS 2-6]